MAFAQRAKWLVLALLVAGLIVGCSWKVWQNRRYRLAIAETKTEMAAGRHAIAARNLTGLLAGYPDSDEAAYLLGVCEQARGRSQAAAQAWARVAPGSSFAARAIEARMSHEIDGGRLAVAEQLINDAAGDPRNDRTALRILLLPIFLVEGRLKDAQQLVVERWEHLRTTGEGASELAVNLARLHIEMPMKPNSVEAVGAELDRAGQRASDDDRVWLGRANLAIRTARHDDAARWLGACQKRRPDDVPVWEARLSWALAAKKAEAVRQALTHLPASASTPGQFQRIDAWLAARQGDHVAERRALEHLLDTEPADLAALSRLAELVQLDGEMPQRAAEIERRSTEIERLNVRYQKLFDRNQPIRDAAEMANLAEKLGRRFEARVFLTVTAAESLNRDDAKCALKRLAEDYLAARK